MARNTSGLKPFPKGVSGNPGGRPKKRPLTDEYFGDLAEVMPPKMCKTLGLPKGSTYAKGHARRRNLDGLQAGGYLATKEMREAIEGKSPIRLEISGPERKVITFRILHDRKKTA